MQPKLCARYGRRDMVTRWPSQALLGRRNECGVLDGLLAAALGGRSGVLVIVGEPGVGKTALLEYAVESASSFRVARAGGVEWEMDFRSRPFSSCARRCWTGWTGYLIGSATR